MPYTDLLRFTVVVTAAEATILAAISAISVGGEPSATTAIVAVAWWAISLILGFWLGRPERAREDVRAPLTRAKTATSLPSKSPARIAIERLWPIAFTAIIGTGYALIVSLSWHTREAAVQAIEERDGVRFFVVPGSALKPIELVRTPGLRSDRLNSGAF